MAHRTARSGYMALVERLNRFPQGATPSDLLYRILELLFTCEEARLVAALPIMPFTARSAAARWHVSEAEALRLLDGLADRALLLDLDLDGQRRFVLPPPMAGFFEFSLMRVNENVDQALLSELFYQYMNVEEDFIKELFTRGRTQLGRVFVSEPVLSGQNDLHVLDHERASHVVETATHIGVGTCYCRHKMMHVGKSCDAPMDVCMTFNATACSLIKHGWVREVDRAECLDLLQMARERGLIQFGENVRQRVNFICNCCGCCCEALIAARRFGHLHPVHTTRFLPVVRADSCKGCGRCVRACPVEALGLVRAHDPARPRRRVSRVDENLCLGCGVCVGSCRTASLALSTRAQRVLTPLDTFHRTVVMAIERGTLQHLILDNGLMASHRAMAAVLGVILRLPPVTGAAARALLGSRYLEGLLSKAAPVVVGSGG